MDILNVNLKEKSYPIFLKNNYLKESGEIIKKLVKGKKAYIITDSNVAPLYLDILKSSLLNEGFTAESYIIEPDEKSKSLDKAEEIFDKCLEYKLDRSSTIIAIGGGVVGDLSGFIAACYMRGIEFIQIPTTVLAQVDSSVGGKVAVNLKGGKNLVGAFHQPKGVLIDISLLETLPVREFRNGLSEVIKYGIIWDEEFFNWLEINTGKILDNKESLLYIAKRCCQIKSEIVSKDEKESGIRAILNFGHTIGHAIEGATEYKKYKHGEAVAIGQVLEAFISYKKGYLDFNEYNRIKKLLNNNGLPVEIGEINWDDFIRFLIIDKKNVDETPVFILPIKIGKVVKEKISIHDIKKYLTLT